MLYPEYMGYKSLSNDLRERFGVKGYHDFDPKMLVMLKKQMAIMDKIQGTSFEKTCPEFFE